MPTEAIAKPLITVAALAVIVLRHAVGIDFDNVDLALLIAAAFPWLATIVRTAKLPGGFEFEFQEVRRKQETQETRINQLVQQEQKRQREEMQLLRTLIVNTAISEYGIGHLRSLMSSEPNVYEPSPGLERDLRRLLESGFIERQPGKGLRTIMRGPTELQQHFKITDLGKRALEAWEVVREERDQVAGSEDR